MQKKAFLAILCIAAILIGLFLFNNDQQRPDRVNPPNHETHGLDRRPSKIIYTKHARCRMDCRHIDETEIREILEEGTINHEKSDPASKPDPKYALEGYTDDGQRIRIIFAAADKGMVVITVIDLQKEWNCNCK